jgi:hypothetical protein
MSFNTEIVVYYIYDKEISIQELKYIYNILPGFIEVVFHQNMTVINLQSIYPGNGYGTHLMIHACNEAKKRGISTITLDDCSDRYRSQHNIYTKIGMKYDNENYGPEMNGNIKDISTYKTDSNSPVIYSLVLD